MICVVALDGNKGKSRFCKHAMLVHKAMMGKAAMYGNVAILLGGKVAALFEGEAPGSSSV